MKNEKKSRRAWKASRRIPVALAIAWDVAVEHALAMGDELTLAKLCDVAEANAARSVS